MTRRNKSRLPPKLPDPIRDRPPEAPREASLRDQLKESRVCGRSLEFGREEILSIMRRVTRNNVRARLGCPPFDGVTYEQVVAAVEGIYGWSGDGQRARISPQHTIDAFSAACARVVEVARGGGRLAFATARPASLLTLHRALADAAIACGGDVFDAVESARFDASGRAGPRHRGAQGPRLWWIDRVAVVSDGRSLLGDDASIGSAADELLFTVGRPDLVVADRSFAGAALAAGIEVVALAGLDALAIAVAAWRGMAVRVVPLDELRPPQAYLPLVSVLDAAEAGARTI